MMQIDQYFHWNIYNAHKWRCGAGNKEEVVNKLLKLIALLFMPHPLCVCVCVYY